MATNIQGSTRHTELGPATPTCGISATWAPKAGLGGSAGINQNPPWARREGIWVLHPDRLPCSLGNMMKRTSSIQRFPYILCDHSGSIFGRYLRVSGGSQQHGQVGEQTEQHKGHGRHAPVRQSQCSSVLNTSENVASLSSVFMITVEKVHR